MSLSIILRSSMIVTNIDKSSISEFVLVIGSTDNWGMNMTLEISDGVHTAALTKYDLRAFGTQKQLAFPLSEMQGISGLSSTISKVKITFYSGGYGLDCGFKFLMAR